MSVGRVSVIWCDNPGCPNEVVNVTAQEARDDADRAGWATAVLDDNYKPRLDYCALHKGGKS